MYTATKMYCRRVSCFIHLKCTSVRVILDGNGSEGTCTPSVRKFVAPVKIAAFINNVTRRSRAVACSYRWDSRQPIALTYLNSSWRLQIKRKYFHGYILALLRTLFAVISNNYWREFAGHCARSSTWRFHPDDELLFFNSFCGMNYSLGAPLLTWTINI